ncbi:hypothetical protein GCM10009007_07380 [Formosimonas limnophila]|uniref:Tautomerase enzyme n=1 Tax=Formosimonas limnophila TaxID=1384487 RepID=A0A8J3G0E8_9BURK|nr:tautomerase family protein [Formosimonas limnophila]GHA69085.1 hypothetical protein GCM10009007_07380 [Formosimonas limnophila]
MPIVTLTVLQGRSIDFKNAVFNATHQALVKSGVHQNDTFHRVIELSEDDFRFHPTFPDVKTQRTKEFVLIEILLGTGRSVKVKKEILSNTIRSLSQQGFDSENIMVVFQDIPWENWSPAGGRMPHG